MEPATKSSLLWGVVGALSFLVLVQGYERLASQPISAAVKVGVAPMVAGAVAVLVVTTVLAQTLQPRLTESERS